MQLNKQRLQLWLDGKVAAYNNDSSQDIEMIKRLCEQTGKGVNPGGDANFYLCINGRWKPSMIVEGIPHHPVSWFFEEAPIEQRIEELEKEVAEIRSLINNNLEIQHR